MNKTARKWLLRGGCLVLFLALAAVLLLPPARIRIFGYLRGEQFFDGMPTSYWREVIREQSHRRGPRTPTLWDKVLGYLGLEPPPPDRMAGATRDAAIPVLLELLKDGDPGVRLFAADVLRLNGNGHAALPVVLEMLKQGDPVNRAAAARLLGQLDIPVREAIPLLIHHFEQDTESRWAYLSVLERLGADARPALPTLTRLLEAQPDRNLARVVWSIDPQNQLARSLLKRALQSEDQAICEQMIVMLRHHSQPAQAVSLILEALHDPQAKLKAAHREMLIRGLQVIDPEAAARVPDAAGADR